MNTSPFIAILPMRKGSERVVNKNTKLFCGKPLFTYVLETLLSVKSIAQVTVDTNHEDIIQKVKSSYPKVSILLRPDNLALGNTSMNDVIAHVLDHTPGELFIQTHCTNPLLTTDTIEKSIKTMLTHRDTYDSLFTVTQVQKRFWNDNYKAINHDPQQLIRTQDLEPIFEENSNLYIFSRTSFNTGHNRIGKKPLFEVMDAVEAWDIDTEADFIIGEALYKTRAT